METDPEIALKVVNILNDKNDDILNKIRKLKGKVQDDDGKSDTANDINKICMELSTSLDDIIKTAERQASSVVIPSELINLLDDFRDTDDFLLGRREKVFEIRRAIDASCDKFKTAASVFTDEIRSQLNSA